MSLPSDLATLDPETLEAPESRVVSISGVRSRIAELRKGDSLRSRNRAEIQGLIDGQKPYDQEKMDEAGRGDDANINLREAEGKVGTATTPYYELDFGVPRAVNIEFYLKGASKQKNFELGTKLATRYSETLWGWPGYKIQRQFSHYQMVVFGRGPIMWDGKVGWHHKAKKDDAVWVADDAGCDLSELPEMAIPGSFNPVELWKLIQKSKGNSKNKDERDSSGWDVEMAKQAIIAAAPDTMRAGYEDHWTQYEASLRRGDVQWNNKTAKIKYTDYLVKEFTGKITHCIVLDDTPGRDDSDEDDFLFKKVGRFNSFAEIINPFFFDAGPQAEWYGVKGLGPKIFDSCDLSNRTWCTILNGATTSCGIPMQAANAQAMQKIFETPITRAGGITFIPPDWNVQQINMRGAFDGPLNVVRGINNILESNTGQYQAPPDITPQPTLGQEELQVSKQSTLTRGAYDRYYHFLDEMHKETLRRMLDKKITKGDLGGEEAIEMRRKLVEEDGFPEESLVMDNICSIKAMRNVGYGSPQMQQVIGNQLKELLPTMDEEGRRNVLRFIGINLLGSNVDMAWKPFEEMGVPNDQEAWATFENNILRFPQAQLDVTPAQNPAIHFMTHVKDQLLHAKQVQSGQGDPKALLQHFDNAGPHNQKHLDVMAGDPTRKVEYEQMVKMQMVLGKMADEIKQAVSQMQAEQQPQQPQVDPKVATGLITGLAKVKADQEVKQAALAGKQAIQWDQHNFKKQIKDAELAHSMMIDNTKAMAGSPQ